MPLYTDEELYAEMPLSPNTLYQEQFSKLFDTYKSMQEDKENISFEEVRELVEIARLTIPVVDLREEFTKTIGMDNLATKQQFISMMRTLISSNSLTTPRDGGSEETPESRPITAASQLGGRESADFQEKCLIEVKREKYLEEYNRYIRDHPLLHQVLFDFLNTALIYQPEDVYAFANDYFSKLSQVGKQRTKPKKVIVFSGAVASTTNFAYKVQSTFPHDVERAVGYTTRAKRSEEIEGIHHFFVPSADMMKQMMKEHTFYEVVQIGNEYFGNAKSEIDSILEKDKVCLVFANLKGVQQLQMNFKDAGVQAAFVYIKPTSTTKFESSVNKLQNEETHLDYTSNRISMIEEELKQDLGSLFNLVFEMDDELMTEADIPLEYDMPEALYNYIYNFISK